VRFHDPRHTFTSVAEGAHPRAIMDRLGHSSITVTLNTYGHLLPGLEERLTEALDARAGKPGSRRGRWVRRGSRACRGASPGFSKLASEMPVCLRPRSDSNGRPAV
jgi:hypothetical protein